MLQGVRLHLAHGVPKVSVLGPIPFNAFIRDPGCWNKVHPQQIVCASAKLRGALDSLEGKRHCRGIWGIWFVDGCPVL